MWTIQKGKELKLLKLTIKRLPRRTTTAYIEVNTLILKQRKRKIKTSFPLFMIHPHQIKHLKKVVFHGGIGFFIIRFNYHNETYLIDSKLLIDKIENIDKSSIPYSWFQSHGILIQEGLYPRLAYLKAVDELYFKEDK